MRHFSLAYLHLPRRSYSNFPQPECTMSGDSPKMREVLFYLPTLYITGLLHTARPKARNVGTTESAMMCIWLYFIWLYFFPGLWSLSCDHGLDIFGHEFM